MLDFSSSLSRLPSLLAMSGFAAKDDQVYLLFGKNGWIGGMLITMLKAQGKVVHLADSRTENRAAVIAEIEKYKPTHILNAAGVTGRPNVDWCETNRVATIRANVIGSLNIADICEEYHIHHCLFATGCIFEYDDEHVIGGKGFTEEDTPNFAGSFYSQTKGYVEQMLKEYPNTLTLRGEHGHNLEQSASSYTYLIALSSGVAAYWFPSIPPSLPPSHKSSPCPKIYVTTFPFSPFSLTYLSVSSAYAHQ